MLKRICGFLEKMRENLTLSSVKVFTLIVTSMLKKSKQKILKFGRKPENCLKLLETSGKWVDSFLAVAQPNYNFLLKFFYLLGTIRGTTFMLVDERLSRVFRKIINWFELCWCRYWY
jgi:hypothetical protein